MGPSEVVLSESFVDACSDGTVDDEFLQFRPHAHATFTVLRSHSLSIFIFNGGYRITTSSSSFLPKFVIL